jgi:hypothetical protein
MTGWFENMSVKVTNLNWTLLLISVLVSKSVYTFSNLVYYPLNRLELESMKALSRLSSDITADRLISLSLRRNSISNIQRLAVFFILYNEPLTATLNTDFLSLFNKALLTTYVRRCCVLLMTDCFPNIFLGDPSSVFCVLCVCVCVNVYCTTATGC